MTFSTAYQDADAVYAGTFHADPLYGQNQNDPHDIAVVVLDQPVLSITPATLPAAGSLSALLKGQRITSVGYGAYDVAKAQAAGGTTSSTTTSATRRSRRSARRTRPGYASR